MLNYLPLNRIIKLIASNIIWIALSSYFIFHVFTGARGVVSWIRLSAEVETLEDELKKIKSENSFLENKIKSIRDDNLNLDLLEEQAMKIIGFANKDDIVVLLPKH